MREEMGLAVDPWVWNVDSWIKSWFTVCHLMEDCFETTSMWQWIQSFGEENWDVSQMSVHLAENTKNLVSYYWTPGKLSLSIWKWRPNTGFISYSWSFLNLCLLGIKPMYEKLNSLVTNFQWPILMNLGSCGWLSIKRLYFLGAHRFPHQSIDEIKETVKLMLSWSFSLKNPKYCMPLRTSLNPCILIPFSYWFSTMRKRSTSPKKRETALYGSFLTIGRFLFLSSLESVYQS